VDDALVGGDGARIWRSVADCRASHAAIAGKGLSVELAWRLRRGNGPQPRPTNGENGCSSVERHKSPELSVDFFEVILLTSTSRALPPAPGDTMPSASIMSTRRAARQTDAQAPLQVGDRCLAAADDDARGLVVRSSLSKSRSPPVATKSSSAVIVSS
jgi:hypothetical protein